MPSRIDAQRLGPRLEHASRQHDGARRDCRAEPAREAPRHEQIGAGVDGALCAIGGARGAGAALHDEP